MKIYLEYTSEVPTRCIRMCSFIRKTQSAKDMTTASMFIRDLTAQEIQQLAQTS